MSPAPSSSRGVAAALSLLLLAGCSRSGGTSAGPSPRAVGQVGYVRMADLVKRHPLYGELSRLDDDMAALQLKSVGGAPALAPADLARQQKELQHELDVAAERARTELKAKQDDFSKREAAAIKQALAASGSVPAGGGDIAGAAGRQAQQQASAVTVEAQKNLERYRKDVIAQNQAALVALQRSLNDKAARTYRTAYEAAQKKEADFALQLASEDSAERVSLRAKLSNLVLDDAARDEARKALDAIDRKEADALAALKNRDASTLVALQTKLRGETQAELNRQAAGMNKSSLAKINARELETRKDLVAKLGGGPVTVTAQSGGAAPPAGLPPDTRAKLEALHKQYQTEFDKEAKATLDEFQKTRTELSQRFARLQGVDAGAQAGAGKQMAALQKQREELYDQMVAQIGREVKLVAAKRGIDVVFSDVVAPAGGVDLTDDAEKDIESLHE